jgi:hypothetical protein
MAVSDAQSVRSISRNQQRRVPRSKFNQRMNLGAP